MRYKRLFLLVLFSTILFASPQCWAGVNDTFGIGAKATSLGGAFTAYADDLSAIHYNPAGLTQLEGTHLTVGLHVADIDYEQKVSQKDFRYGTDPEGGTTDQNNSDLLYIPQLGISHTPQDSRWTFAYGVYAPFGLHGWWNSSNANNRYDTSETYNDRIIYASPTIAYKIRDNLSVGFSVGMGSTDEGVTINLRVPMVTAATGGAFNGYTTSAGKLKFELEDQTTFSANIGLMWQAIDWMAVGLTYRSESHSKMTGHSTYSYSEEGKTIIDSLYGAGATPDQETCRTRLSFTHPQSVSLGFKFDLTEKWRVMLDCDWTDWSVRRNEKFNYDCEPMFLRVTADFLNSGKQKDALVVERHWKDTYEFRIGTEYEALDWLTLRFGYHYRPSAVPEKYWDNTWPLIDYHVFSFGSGMKINKKMSLDFAYSLVWGNDHDIENNESKNLTQDTSVYSPYYGDEVNVRTEIHNFMLTFNYRF